MYLIKRRYRKPNRVAGLMALIAVILTLSALTLQKPEATRAQNAATCESILPEVQKRLTSCSAMDRDQVCYGNPAVTATFVDQSNPLTFAKTGDIVDLSALKTLQTTPLSADHTEWGIAALKVQVNNLDGTATGQAATFVLFGDTQLNNATPQNSASTTKSSPPPACAASTSRLSNLRYSPASSSQSVKVLPANSALNISGRLADGSWLFADDTKGQTGWVLASSVKPSCDVTTEPVIDPSQPTVLTGLRAFYFTTGVQSQAACKDIPEGGFMVRTPTGRHVDFSVNGTDLSVGSTVEGLLVGNQLVLMVLDGEITVTVNGQTVTVHAGQQLNVNVQMQGDPPVPVAVGPLPNPVTYQNPANSAVRCAVDPVIAYGCFPTLPNNLTVNNVTGGDGDPILRPNGGENVVNGAHRPPPGPPPACIPMGQGYCTSDAQCCPSNFNGYSFPGFCDTFYSHTCSGG